MEPGKLVESEQFTGLDSVTAQGKIIEYAISQNVGGEHVDYKLRDWLISRQRFT